MTEQRLYLVFYDEFRMDRHPQTHNWVAVLTAYDAADALVDAKLRLKTHYIGPRDHLRVVAVRPPSVSSESEQALVEESADMRGDAHWYTVDLTARGRE